MSESREKARALLAEVKAGSVPLRDAADATKALAQSLGLLAALCDENDALRQRAAAAEAGAAAMRDVERRMSNEVVRLMDELATAHFRTENATAARDRAQGRLDNQCAGLVQMARDRDAALAENRAIRAEVERLKSIGADLLSVAMGCTDYGGGHRGDCYDAFQHGIQTVVNVLKPRLSGDDSYQMRVLKSVGDGLADNPRDLDAEVVAGVQASRTTPDPKP